MCTAVQASNEETFPWGLPASLLFHALLAMTLLLSPAAPKLMQVPPVASVAVDILSPRQLQAAVEPAPAATAPPAIAGLPSMPDAKAARPPTSNVKPETPPDMIVAKTMLSGKTLADPRSRQARKELATFADSERIIQLCNLEAMDQVEAWRSDFRPEQLVAYARSDVKLSGETIVADGAAFRSRDLWYDINFECQVAPDHGKVVSFAFHVGEPVPRKDWEELNLPAVH